MSTHAAGRRHHGTTHRPLPAHARATGRPLWWNTDRGKELARDIGDFVDELHQLAAVALAVLIVLGAVAAVTAALWPVEPHAAAAFAGTALELLAVAVWRLRRMGRRP